MKINNISSFKIAGVPYCIKHIDNIKNGTLYGQFEELKQTIFIANRVKDEDGEWVNISDELKTNVIYHELGHLFQRYLNKDYDEKEAQIFANFMSEFELSKRYD